MLTGLFFLGGLAAFTYLCWWIYDNERNPDGMLPRRGLLAMATLDDLAEDAKQRKRPAWKREKLKAAQQTESPTPTRTAGWSRTPGQQRKRR